MWTGHYLRGLEPQLIKLEFIIYLPKLKVIPICLSYILDLTAVVPTVYDGPWPATLALGP